MADQKVKYTDPQYYQNRELSWLKFDRRCLSEARNKDNPLFERLKFLSITASNLDEFFMVRVASLQDMINAGYKKRDIAGMTAQEQLDALLTETHQFMQRQYSTYNKQLVTGLKENGLEIVGSYEDLTEKEQKFVEEFFENEVFPVLTPMAVDNSRPFPLVRNKSLNICALLKRKEGTGQGIPGYMRKPKKADREIREDSWDPFNTSILEKEGKGGKTAKGSKGTGKDSANVKTAAKDAREKAAKKDSRDARTDKKDVKTGKEKDAKEKNPFQYATIQVPAVLPRILELPESPVRRIIFLEEIIRHHLPGLFLNYEKEFEVGDDRIYEIDGPLDLTFLMKLYGIPGFEWLRESRYAKPQEIPALPSGCNIFEQIRGGDIFMHHPYQTFQPVVDFVAQAADDPDVLAIKQTLYRVSGNSPIIAALARAAENGKQVTVLVELKARFDEENNIVWARMLEHAGCHVIYGLIGLKTHSKITLVVRREMDGIRRYVHLATGNYNDTTARIYTDIGIMTCRDDIGEDATSAFNMLSGYSEPRYWNCLALAPLWLKDRFLHLIRREAAHAANGEKACIRAKMNSLCDPDIMEALYEASSAGVRIDLIVRGICCLKVGIPGVSENIHVRSIVGNFLEHSRIFYFENGGRPEVFAASADWMPRNLDRRVEILFPILDRRIAEKVTHILDVELADTVKAHVLKADGSYDRVDKRGKELIDSQRVFCDEAVKEAQEALHPRGERVFIPAEAKEN